jgi:hypothetical protein
MLTLSALKKCELLASQIPETAKNDIVQCTKLNQRDHMTGRITYDIPWPRTVLNRRHDSQLKGRSKNRVGTDGSSKNQVSCNPYPTFLQQTRRTALSYHHFFGCGHFRYPTQMLAASEDPFLSLTPLDSNWLVF